MVLAMVLALAPEPRPQHLGPDRQDHPDHLRPHQGASKGR